MTEASLRSYTRRNALTAVPELSPARTDIELDEGWTLGKPFRIARVGLVYDRITGKARIPRAVTREDLADAVRVAAVHRPSLDVDHAEWEPQGAVVAMALVDDGDAIAILPAYNPSLAAYVDRCSGALWSSPVMVFKPYHSPATGERLGGYYIRSVAITSDPATLHANLDPVSLTAAPASGVVGAAIRLSTDASDASPIPTEQVTSQEKLSMDEEVKAAFDAIMSRLDALEKAMSALQEGKADEAEGEGEMSEEKASEDALKAEALSARNQALEARLKALEEQNLKHEMATAIDAFMSSKRLTPAERATAEKVYRQSKALFDEVYGSRAPVIPSLKGHGGVEAAASLTDRQHRAIEERMASAKVLYHVAAKQLMSERNPLFVGKE